MTRIRSAAQRAPQTLEAATALLTRYAAANGELATITAAADAEVAAIKASTDTAVVPLVAELRDIAKQLKPWWSASSDALTDGGKRKSIEIAGCQIGVRMSPPKVEHGFATDGDAIGALRGTGWYAQTVRVSYALDKPAILKLLDGEAQRVAEAEEAGQPSEPTLTAIGFASKQSEQFFVDVATKPSLAEQIGV